MGVALLPPDKKILKTEYDKQIAVYHRLLDEIDYCLEKLLKEGGIQINRIEKRIKTFDSCFNKILQRGIESNYLENLDDIAGLRVICLYRSDLELIEKIIKENFKIAKLNLIKSHSSTSFGYMSDHYVVKLPISFSGPRYDDIGKLQCEIQVRTVSMHAWATVSQHLDYKQEIDIPKELKKDFYALSGIFYVVDSLFEQFRESRLRSILKLNQSLKEVDLLNLEINYDTLDAFITWKFPERPGKNDSIYPEHLSNLTQEIFLAGYLTLDQLNKVINDNIEWLLKQEKEHLKKNEIEREIFYTGIGTIREILKKIHPETYRQIKLRRAPERLIEV